MFSLSMSATQCSVIHFGTVSVLMSTSMVSLIQAMYVAGRKSTTVTAWSSEAAARG
jgi:hypothetical protein